jgi:hypothetical protein
MHHNVMKSCRSWLQTQGFAQELADCYAEVQPSASPNGCPAERLGNSGAGGGPPWVIRWPQEQFSSIPV